MIKTHLPKSKKLHSHRSSFKARVVRDAIKRLKNNKSPGSDGIPAEFLKYDGDTLADQIHEIMVSAHGTKSGAVELSAHFTRKGID